MRTKKTLPFVGSSSRLAVLVGLAITSAGCWFQPFDPNGHACRLQSDCLAGYRCEANVCVAGEPLDAGVDADLDAQAPADASRDARPMPDAPADGGTDSGMPDTGAPDAAMDAGNDGGPDADLRDAGPDDADLRDGGPNDAGPTEDAAGLLDSGSARDAASPDDAGADAPP